jgi:hypothetical protein
MLFSSSNISGKFLPTLLSIPVFFVVLMSLWRHVYKSTFCFFSFSVKYAANLQVFSLHRKWLVVMFLFLLLQKVIRIIQLGRGTCFVVP